MASIPSRERGLGQWGRSRAVRVAVAALAFAALTGVTVLIAWPRMFSSFAVADDEGYMLIALRSFVEHGSLYNDVFSQYGPFYYDLWGGLFSLFGIPVDHDSGRTVTLVVWVLSSLGLGLATMRITRSLLLGLVVQVVAFSALGVMTGEPMHAGGLIALLLTMIVLASCFVGVRPSPWAMAVLGGATAALVLVKINVGGFAAISLALACVVSFPALASRRWLRPAIEVVFVAVPLILLSSKFGEEWARHYAVHVSIAALAAVAVLRTHSTGGRPTEELWWLGGGLVAVGLTTILATLGSGTSPHGLLEGTILQPLRQGDVFTLPLQLASRTWTLDLIALAGALGYWYAERRRREAFEPVWSALVSAVSVAVGVELILSVIGKTLPADSVTTPGYPFALLAFSWVALVRVRRPDPERSFAVLLLPLLAVLQALHAFPVAGSQMGWSTFLLAPVGAICVANGVRGLAGALGDRIERRAVAGAAAGAAAVLLVFVANVTVREPLRADRAVYRSEASLGLPGASRVRLPDEQIRAFRHVTAAIDRNCPAFLTLPGMNSFYIWTGQEPPTGFNATAWPGLLDDAHERRVVEAVSSIDGLCLLRNEALAALWGDGGSSPGPLVRFLGRGFRPIARVDQYELLKREPRGASG